MKTILKVIAFIALLAAIVYATREWVDHHPHTPACSDLPVLDAERCRLNQ